MCFFMDAICVTRHFKAEHVTVDVKEIERVKHVGFPQDLKAFFLLIAIIEHFVVVSTQGIRQVVRA